MIPLGLRTLSGEDRSREQQEYCPGMFVFSGSDVSEIHERDLHSMDEAHGTYRDLPLVS
jgi:hypothetical protein